jgi:hypothetical protein
MTTDQLNEERAMQALAALRTLDPGRERTERVRARCHAALGRPAWRERLALFVAGVSWLHVLEAALVGLVSAIYLSEVVRRALVLYGLLG